MTTDIPAVLIEQIEAEGYAEFTAAAPAAARADLGTQQLRIGGGVALALPNDPSGFFSKAIGLGFDEPLTGELIERVIAFYRAQGMPSAKMLLAPEALPPDWPEIRAKLGLREVPPGVFKLAGDLRTMSERAAPVSLDVGLRVVPVEPGQAREWGQVMFEAFGLPIDPHHEMQVGVHDKVGWHSFAVMEGDAIVAAASLYVRDRVADLFGAATLSRARRRGAQSALIAARVTVARRAGCDWLVGDTAPEKAGQHNSSLRNMQRAGLEICYLRQSWTWG